MRTMPARPRSREVSWSALGFGLLVMPFTSIVYGATLAKLWEWFVADTFDVKALSTAEAIGLSMVVTFVTYQVDARHDDDDVDWQKIVSLIFSGLARCLLALVFAAIVKAFV